MLPSPFNVSACSSTSDSVAGLYGGLYTKRTAVVLVFRALTRVGSLRPGLGYFTSAAGGTLKRRDFSEPRELVKDGADDAHANSQVLGQATVGGEILMEDMVGKMDV